MSNNLQIFTQNDAESAAAEAGEQLNLALEENKKLHILLLVSGGSALSILNYVGGHVLGANLTVSVLDERFSEDPAVNNFCQLQKTDFYQEAFDAEASFFGTLPRPGETIEQLVERWAKNLHRWREENPGGLIMATLGLGADGHTAGIFPDEDTKKFSAMFESTEWILAYDVGSQSQFSRRLTTTLTFFKLIDAAFAFVAGVGKKEKLDAVMKTQGAVNLLPALAWQKIKKVKVFTDIELK